MSNRNCSCQNLAKEYITNQAELANILRITTEFIATGALVLISSLDEGSSYIHREFRCMACGQYYELTADTSTDITGRFGKKSTIRSEHIRKIELFCEQNKIEETYRGPHLYDTNNNCEWVYFDCWFDEYKMRNRFNLPATVKYYEYDGRAAGQESGFIDEETSDAVLGNHPLYAINRRLTRLG